jgi:hypothetical protein
MLKNALVIAVLVLGGAAVFASCGTNTTCPAGARRCPCTPTGGCDSGLMCLTGENVCIAISAMPGFGGSTGTGGNTQTGGKGGTPGGQGGTPGGQGGTPGGQGGTPGNGTCPSAIGATTCRMCIDQKCCLELTTCQNSAPCGNLLSCLGKCADNDQACVNACANANQAGITPLNNLFDCLDGKCTEACPTTPPPDGGAGGAGGSAPPVGDGGANTCPDPANATPCRICIDQKCCPQFNTCNNSAMCPAFANCLSACAMGDTACEQACATKFPGGVTPLDAFEQCGQQNCSTTCM